MTARPASSMPPPPLTPPAPNRRRLLGLALAGSAALAGCATTVSLDEPFEGTPWRLIQLEGKKVSATPGDPQAEPRIQFDAATQRVSGSTGCNQLGGTYRRDANLLRIGPLMTTRMACADSARTATEGRITAALEATYTFSITGAQLTLLDARSLPVAVFELGLRPTP